MFAGVPAGGDVYMMGNIIHQGGDQDAVKILSNCAAALNESGRVALVEQLVPPRNTPDLALLDLSMLLLTEGGRQRTLEEFNSLFRQSGLEPTRVVETESAWCVLEAVKS